jgi:hypothetical protein
LWGFIRHYSLVWLAASLHSFIAFCVSGIVWTENIISFKKQWPKQESLIPGQKNAVNTPLINPEKVYLPSLHILLGLTKNFDQNSAEFMCLNNKFPRTSDDKI